MSIPSRRPLPSWATFMPQSHPGETSLGGEEFELRLRSYRCASQRVSNACIHTLERPIDERIAVPLRRFLVQFQPQSQSQYSVSVSGTGTGVGVDIGVKRRRVEMIRNCNDLLRNYIDSMTYHPTILPIAIVRLSPSEMDRSLVVQLLKRRLRFHHACRDGDGNENGPRPRPPQNVPDEVHIQGGGGGGGNYSNSNSFRPVVCTVTDRVSMQHAGRGTGTGSSKAGTRGDHGDYLRDILIQCIQQETNPYEYAHLLGRSRKALKMGWSRQIVEWARTTTTFNAIVVILENAEAIPKQIFNDLIVTISSFRSDAGIPISLVLCSSCSDLVEGRLSSTDAHDGEAGIFVRDFEMISSNVLYDEFFDNLYSKRKEDCFLPVLLPVQTLRNIRNEFVRYHRSVAGVAAHLKMVLAHHFARRGAFLTLADDRLFFRHYGVHLAWFCVDSYARDWIFGKKRTFKCDNYQDLLKSMQISQGKFCHQLIVHKIVKIAVKFAKMRKESQWKIDMDETFINVPGYILEKSHGYTSIFERIYASLRIFSCTDLIALLTEWAVAIEEYTRASGHRNVWDFIEDGYCHAEDEREAIESSAVKISNDFLIFLKESVILLDVMQNDGATNEEVQNDFRENLVETLHRYLWSIYDAPKCSTLPNFHFGRNEEKSLSAEPRRTVASSILTPPKATQPSNVHADDTRIAFSILDTRVVSTEYWFHEFAELVFHDSKDDGNLMKDTLDRFAFAVYQLMYCGYIVRSRRGPDFFEKGAMVWTRE